MYSIVIPAYNEEGAIRDLVERTAASNPDAELILVDDGSRDGTWRIMEAFSGDGRIKAFKHRVNMGKAHALKTGYINAGSETIVTIDADLSYAPEDIPALVAKFNQGYDMVIGSRFTRGIPRELSLVRCLANIAGSFIAGLILQRRVTDLTTGLRVFNRRVAFMDVKARNLEYEAELTSRVITNRMQYAEVPVAVEKRVGKSKLKFLKNCYLFLKAVFVGKFF